MNLRTIIRPSLTAELRALPVGAQTIDGAEQSILRFLITGDGTAATRGIVADTARAAALLDSPAGPRMERALRRFASQTDTHDGAHNLRSFTLAPDADSVAAARLRTALLHGEISTDVTVARRTAEELAQGMRQIDGRNGAFNGNGDIFLMPDYSRGLLASVGAYKPVPGEIAADSAAAMHDFLPRLLRHEVEHSITPSAGGNLRWLEEGIAETLTQARPATAAARHDLPAFATQYGRTSTAARAATAGWGAHPTPTAARAAEGAASSREYVQRRDIVRELLRMSGIDQHTRAGYADARALLQGNELADVPSALATRLIRHNDASPELAPLLTAMVEQSGNLPAQLDSLGSIRALLGR